MAEPGEASSTAPGDAWLFCVRAGGSRFALDAALVAEVVRLGLLTRLPAAPPYMPGVFSHRGEVLGVLDLAHFLGDPAVPLGASTRATLVRVGDWRLAIVAHSIEGLTVVPREALEPPPGEGGTAAYVSAVARDDRGPIAVLDLSRLVEAARSRSLPA